MNTRSFLLATALGLVAWPALANPQRLDDSRSHTVPPNAQMQWTPQTRSDRDGGMEAHIRVNVHIDTRQWMGRSGRIYMVLPRDEASGIEAVWTTLGRLRSGRLVSGERSLVFSGTLRGAELTDQLQMHLRSGPDWQSDSRRLHFHFELDVDPAPPRP